MSSLIPLERIENKIFLIRGQKVMLDRDLAELYMVQPIRLREQVKRNSRRFPKDFMFQLTAKETKTMVSQNAIPSKQHLGGHLPLAFTEQGVAMLSSVLRSQRAIEVNIVIANSTDIASIFGAIKKMLMPPEEKPKQYGFQPVKDK